jgi:predicted transcriptional regulator
MKWRRSSDMIIAQILEACIDGVSKTRIVYQCNLNFTTVNPYLDLLTGRGLIAASGGQRVRFRTTASGLELMERLKRHHCEISKLRSQIEDALASELSASVENDASPAY